MQLILIPSTALLLLFSSVVHAANICQVIGANGALTHRMDKVDAAVVALTAQSNVTNAALIPPSLLNLNTAMSARLAKLSLAPTPVAADPGTESTLVESWALLANTVEDLMADYVYHENILITLLGAGVQAEMYGYITGFNATFSAYATFMAGTVTDPGSQASIQSSTVNAVGNGGSGIVEAENAYAPAPS